MIKVNDETKKRGISMALVKAYKKFIVFICVLSPFSLRAQETPPTHVKNPWHGDIPSEQGNSEEWEGLEESALLQSMQFDKLNQGRSFNSSSASLWDSTDTFANSTDSIEGQEANKLIHKKLQEKYGYSLKSLEQIESLAENLFAKKEAILQATRVKPTHEEFKALQTLDEAFNRELEKLAFSEGKDPKAYQNFFKEREKVVSELSREGLIQGILL